MVNRKITDFRVSQCGVNVKEYIAQGGHTFFYKVQKAIPVGVIVRGFSQEAPIALLTTVPQSRFCRIALGGLQILLICSFFRKSAVAGSRQVPVGYLAALSLMDHRQH